MISQVYHRYPLSHCITPICNTIVTQDTLTRTMTYQLGNLISDVISLSVCKIDHSNSLFCSSFNFNSCEVPFLPYLEQIHILTFTPCERGICYKSAKTQLKDGVIQLKLLRRRFILIKITVYLRKNALLRHVLVHYIGGTIRINFLYITEGEFT